MDSDLFTDELGPLWSNNGTRTWSLLLAPDRIIAWPYTFAESFRLALRFQLKFWPWDPGAALRERVGEGLREAYLPRGREVRRYDVHLLRSLVIRSNSTANTITFEKLSGETDEYAIALHGEVVEVFTATREQLLGWIRDGTVTDVKTIIGGYWLERFLAGAG